MKAVLLVAGLGTRLRPLTNSTPKCLLPIGGKPLMQIWFEKLETAGVKEVLVNTHWLAEKVEAFIAEKRRGIGFKTRLFHEPELLGSAGTLYANRQWLCNDDKPFFIIYGDNLTWVDLDQMRRFHETHDHPVTLGVFMAPRPERCGIAEIDDNGTVVSFIEKPENPKSNMAAGGIYIADRRIFDVFPDSLPGPEDVLDLGFHIFPKLGGRMKVYGIDELIDIGTHSAYEEANLAWQKKRGEE